MLVGLTMTWYSEKMPISNRCICGLMPNLIKKSWTDSIFRLYQLWRVNSQIFQSFFIIPPPQIKSRWKCSTKFNDSLFNHVASWNFRRATNKFISGIYYWFPCANYSHGYSKYFINNTRKMPASRALPRRWRVFCKENTLAYNWGSLCLKWQLFRSESNNLEWFHFQIYFFRAYLYT